MYLRDSGEADAAFVMSTWLRTWRMSPYAGCISNNDYARVTRGTIEQLVLRGATIRVCAADEKPGARLYGWLCSELSREGNAIVHYGYCKDPYVGLGVLEALVAEVPGTHPIRYSHRTTQLVRALPADARHCPEAARRKA